MSTDSSQQLKPWGTILLHNDVQRGLESLFASYMKADPPLKGQDLLDVVKEDLGPMQLASPKIVSYYDILKRIRIFLETSEVNLPRNAETGHLIGKRVIAAIWKEEKFDDERKKALEYFDAVRNGEAVLYSPTNAPNSPPSITFRVEEPRVPANPSPAQPVVTGNVPVNNGVAAGPEHNVPNEDDQYENKRYLFFASKYRSRRDKFSGHLEEDWGDHISTFMDFCSDQKLRGNERSQYLHYSLHEDALNFYKADVRDKIRSWGAVVSAFSERYSSLTTREDISKKLESLHLVDFVTENITPRSALDSLIKEIDLLAPMAHTEDRTDRRKRKFLATPCQGIPWACNALSQADTRHLSYRELCSELFSAEFNERKYAEGERRVTQRATSDDASDVQYRPRLTMSSVNLTQKEHHDPEVLYSGPGRYGRTPSSRSSFKPATASRPQALSSGNVFSKSHSDIPAVLHSCWNCDRPNCRLYTCPHPRNETSIKRNRQLARDWLRKNRTRLVNLVEDSNRSDIVEQLAEALLCELDEPGSVTEKEDLAVKPTPSPTLFSTVYPTLVHTSRSLFTPTSKPDDNDHGQLSSDEGF
eukprot:TRINITY_DN1884_c0_g1_i1.p1 TRINITY_DN1884_c0_g1~~TRINITY_DN1884_c0_g1_i1.p1  ORF type:complete len:587 (-),score=68.26 TRINITY_DN1884_c0_g1_i1:3690-5450(-)